ncbi:cytochrome P450 7B1 [Dunckerocampus dactyliophorus]|uniref:cytochrome P450 7B1 n=1 Tax=Dunckerocampus dactyliophorus TaxID=161453 RepID=UPI002404ABB1|nr:cytochrome P450 7B1 [Dunckerocampus dactyliophorus]
MFPPLLWTLLLVLGLVLVLGLFVRRRRRRDGEPPLINGWIPFIGKALAFGKDAHKFLEAQKKKSGDVFTVHIAGRYMTFFMDPLMYPAIIKHGRQLDFHEFSNKVAPFTFGYPPVIGGKFPGLAEQIRRSFQMLQGDHLTVLTESMMANLMMVLRQDHLSWGTTWRTAGLYDFCGSIMFEATFLTLYGRPAHAVRHSRMAALRDHFFRFDAVFPLLIAQIPIWLLGRTQSIRDELIRFFLPQRTSSWSHASHFIKRRSELFEQQHLLRDVDKAAHHFAILWASVGNTVSAAFWAAYHLLSQPVALVAVRREIHDVLKQGGMDVSGDADVMISRDLLDKLLHLESAIKESLRLSSASMNIRVVQEDMSLCLDAERSVSVRRGDIIALYPQSMHMDANIYEEPQMFRYDRFVQDGREKADFFKDGHKLRYFLMPFGSGSSMCPGRFFAINEIKQFLCLLLLYFDLELEAGQPAARLDTSRAGLGILQPANDVRFHYRLRSNMC